MHHKNTNPTTQQFYTDIISKVLEKTKEEFAKNNMSEEVLSDMKKVIKYLLNKKIST